MTSVTEAISIAKQAAPTLGPASIALLVAIGGLESHWGDWWPGTNNWGAIVADSSWKGPTFEHSDSKYTPEGNVSYVTKFRAYSTPTEGAADLGRLLAARYHEALAQAGKGNWLGASQALYDAGYYTGTQPRKAAIVTHYRNLSKYLLQQGISPATIGAAVGLEWLFWGVVGAYLVKRKLKGTRHG
jgi:flagellum-specific peptidoglycan hydrolase FlgJ